MASLASQIITWLVVLPSVIKKQRLKPLEKKRIRHGYYPGPISPLEKSLALVLLPAAILSSLHIPAPSGPEEQGGVFWEEMLQTGDAQTWEKGMCRGEGGSTRIYMKVQIKTLRDFLNRG